MVRSVKSRLLRFLLTLNGWRLGLRKLSDDIEEELEAIQKEVTALSPAQSSFRPGEGRWSVVEVLDHLASSAKGMSNIAASLHQGRAIPARSVGPADAAPRPSIALEEAFESWRAMREKVRLRLASLSAPLDTSRSFSHDLLGPLDARQWLALNRHHIRSHRAQIRRILANRGCPAREGFTQ